MNINKHINSSRKRLIAYLRQNGIMVDRSIHGWAKLITKDVERISGIKKENEKSNVYQIRVAKLIRLEGRDLIGITPKWADKQKIRDIYKACKLITKESGIKHHVDHVIPVKGKKVSGLHVHTNLAIIKAVDNLKKSNKFK